MGYAVGFDTAWNRDIGYGVPAECDHPDCRVSIDRGLYYVCGGGIRGGDRGCGLYFCGAHLWLGADDDDPQMCERCEDHEPPFEAKPDVPEWIKWKLNDPSWAQWRNENPEVVKQMCTTGE